MPVHFKAYYNWVRYSILSTFSFGATRLFIGPKLQRKAFMGRFSDLYTNSYWPTFNSPSVSFVAYKGFKAKYLTPPVLIIFFYMISVLKHKYKLQFKIWFFFKLYAFFHFFVSTWLSLSLLIFLYVFINVLTFVILMLPSPQGFLMLSLRQLIKSSYRPTLNQVEYDWMRLNLFKDVIMKTDFIKTFEYSTSTIHKSIYPFIKEFFLFLDILDDLEFKQSRTLNSLDLLVVNEVLYKSTKKYWKYNKFSIRSNNLSPDYFYNWKKQAPYNYYSHLDLTHIFNVLKTSSIFQWVRAEEPYSFLDIRIASEIFNLQALSFKLDNFQVDSKVLTRFVNNFKGFWINNRFISNHFSRLSTLFQADFEYIPYRFIFMPTFQNYSHPLKTHFTLNFKNLNSLLHYDLLFCDVTKLKTLLNNDLNTSLNSQIQQPIILFYDFSKFNFLSNLFFLQSNFTVNFIFYLFNPYLLINTPKAPSVERFYIRRVNTSFFSY